MPQQRYGAERLRPVKAIEIRTEKARSIGPSVGNADREELDGDSTRESREILSKASKIFAKMKALFDARSENVPRGPGQKLNRAQRFSVEISLPPSRCACLGFSGRIPAPAT
jgi:hypothetical protein